MEQLFCISFLCQVTQKLKGMEDSISDLNTNVIDSSAGGGFHFSSAGGNGTWPWQVEQSTGFCARNWIKDGGNPGRPPGHPPRGWRVFAPEMCWKQTITTYTINIHKRMV